MLMKLHIHGRESLRKRAAEIPEITPEIKKLAGDMFETMYYNDGIGLAAPQVGVSLQIAVIHVPREETGKMVLINPVILERSGSVTIDEGCLSVPGITASVKRAEEVTVEFTTLAGKRKRKSCKGLTALAVQHEVDHLEGKLYIDRISVARRTLLSGKLRRLGRRGAGGETP